NAAATRPKSSCTSPRCQPRITGTRRINAHQNTKKVRLLSAMSAACMTNAPRSASAARRLVASRLRAKTRLFAFTDIPPFACLSAVDRQDAYGAGERPAHAERNHAAPERETRRERARREQAGAEHERRRRGEQHRERRQRRQPLHDLRIQMQRQHHLSFGGLRPPEAPRHALSLAASPARAVRVARSLRSLAGRSIR